jgi:hypothetical protein
VFFQQASTAAKTSTLVRQLSATLAEGRVLIKGLPLTADDSNLNGLLIAAGAVPPDMVTGPWTISNPFGGTTEFYGSLPLPLPGAPNVVKRIHIVATNIPQGVCARLLTASSGSASGMGGFGVTTLVSSGYVLGGAAASHPVQERNYAMNATQAGWMCKYGSNSYNTQSSEPATAPISGNVIISMSFLVEA